MQSVRRLIEYFAPNHYQLSLTLQRMERTFEGTVTIHGVSPKDGESVAVHAKDLLIGSVTFDGKKAEFEAGEHDELVIRCGDIKQGAHIMVIGFRGTITDAMHGLYPCYFDVDGVKKELLATQFESHHAREVFPCIDEPEAKATFDLILTTETDVTVLANTAVREQRAENNQLVTFFESTPKMSTYLLGWVVGEMQHMSTKTTSGVDVGIWATQAHSPESLDFALEVAVRSIEFFDDYFGIPYPLSKCDHVALPDFSSGAMENWGLITYREMALLADPLSTSVSSKHYIATVIAHEVSHQWFGNLVTMKWWNDLWLNESFATLMEYIAIDAIYPEWNVWLDFATGETIMALRRDALEGVQAVQVDVNHPDEISTLFDGAIVYAKGARLMRMLEHFVGAESFRAGLKAYFTDYAYGNTEGEDLWRVLSEHSGADVSSFMHKWISQSGFPVLHASERDGSVTLSQEQFFTGPHKDSAQSWPIPLNSSIDEMPHILDQKSTVVPRKSSETIRFNVGDSAHFITSYDEGLLGRIIEDVKRSHLGPLDRLQLLDEQTLLARAGYVNSASLIPLLGAYEHESSEPVWDIVSMAIRELRKFIEEDENAEKHLRAFSADTARDQYLRLGWETDAGEPESDTKLRATIIGLMLYGEEPDVIKQAVDIYESNTLDRLEPELRPLLISAAVRHGSNTSLLMTLIDQYKAAVSPELQSDIAIGLTSARKPEELEYLLSLIREPLTVRPQDSARWFAYILYNRQGRLLAWTWLKENWNWIRDTFGGDKSYDDFPRIASNALVTRKQLEDYSTFFEPMLREPALTRVLELGKKEIESRVLLIERDSDAVIKALAKL